jgi:hypothetical protein
VNWQPAVFKCDELPTHGLATPRETLVDSLRYPEDPASPEDCPRSLAAGALLWAHPDRPLFPESLRLMAVANAFMMLGLLPETRVRCSITAGWPSLGKAKIMGPVSEELPDRHDHYG